MELRKFIKTTIREYLNESVNKKSGKFNLIDVFNTIRNNGSFDFYDLYPNYSEPFDEDEETMFQTKEKAEQYANYVIEIFSNLPQYIPIYRAIYVKNESDIDYDYLGESWSLYKENAISFGSHNGSNYLISATIDKKYVDWEETLKRFTLFSFGDDIDDENEIVVSDMSKIKNIKTEKLRW